MIATPKIDLARLPVPPLEPTRARKPKAPSTEGAVIIELPQGYSDGHEEKEHEPWNKGKRQPRPNALWTPERDKVLEELYLQGKLNAEIADQLGMTPKQVMSRIYSRKRQGSLPDVPLRTPWTWTEEQRRTFDRMYRAGEPYSAIAAAIGKTAKACETRASDLRKEGRLPKRRDYSRRDAI